MLARRVKVLTEQVGIRFTFRLKKIKRPRFLELSMAGLTFGAHVLQIDGPDPGLIAALAGDVGRRGRAAAVVKTHTAAEAFSRAAARAGVHVEVKVASLDALPCKDGDFDLVVVKHVLADLSHDERVALLREAFRVLRTGGRCLVIDHAMRRGLGAVFSFSFSRRPDDHEYLRQGGAVASLKGEGFQSAHLLAERDGLTFSEGAKPGLSSTLRMEHYKLSGA